MILLIDNYDSFTFNLSQQIESYGHECRVIRNDKLTLNELIDLNPSHLVLSPGPGRPEEAGITLEAIECFSGKIPVLGICLGHQAIAQVYGGNVVLAPVPYHGKCSEILHEGIGVFKGINQGTLVARYHSLIVEKETLPEELKVTGETHDGLIMGLRHWRYPTIGLQFHPESYASSEGAAMLKNFLKGDFL